MNPTEYQQLARRTECDQGKVRERIYHIGIKAIRALHASIGLPGDAGELCSAIEKWLWYGQPLDVPNVKEEIGDCLWYLSLMADAAGLTLEECMEGNVHKLETRFPEKYTDHHAAEENRDREAERKTMSTEGCRIPATDFRFNNNYNRLCNRCQMVPIHKDNQLGICPDCAALERASKLETE